MAPMQAVSARVQATGAPRGKLANRRSQRVNAAPSKQAQGAGVTGVTGAVVGLATPGAAEAAQELATVAGGEPELVKLGWGALLATFSFSIALVVWGRSGF